MNWSMHTRPRIGAEPVVDPHRRRRCRRRGARLRRTPQAPARRWCRDRRSRCARRRRRRRCATGLLMARLARTVMAGTRPRSWVWPGAGSRPYDAMPHRTRLKRADGRSTAAAELARCRSSGRTPSASASSTASRKAASWASLAGWSGSSLAARCDQMPVMSRRPACSSSAACANTSLPVGAGRAAAREAGVDLELDPGPRAGLGDLVELGARVGRQVDVGGHRCGVLLARHRQPAQHRTGVAGGAQRQRLVEGGDAEPVGAGLRGRRGRPRPCRGRSRRP